MEPGAQSNDRDRDDWENLSRALTDITRVNPADEFRYRHVIELLGIAGDGEGCRILDAGCGSGTLIERAGKEKPKAQLAGLDFTNAAVSAAKRFNPTAEFLLVDLLAKDAAPPARFERWATHCICSEVLEHLDNPVDFLVNLEKWLAPGALIAFTVPGGPMAEIHRHLGHRRHHTATSITEVLAGAGLTVERVERWGFPFFNVYRAITLVAGKRLVRTVNAGGGDGEPSPLLRLMFAIFRPLFHLNLRDSALGWQIFAVARLSER